MNKLRIRRAAEVTLALLLVCLVADVTPGYSVLSHEAIIDSTWDKDIKPLLLKRFPSASADESREAHAHAYGGAIIQDMGYYPFGSKFFSDLTHYVRSGDFVEALIRDSQDMDRLASHKFETVTPGLRENILAFYGDTNALIATENDKGKWQKTLREMAGLRSAGVLPQRTVQK
jgi:hypothetical protein